MPKVIVYVPAADARALEAKGHNVPEWVREIVKWALGEFKEATDGK